MRCDFNSKRSARLAGLAKKILYYYFVIKAITARSNVVIDVHKLLIKKLIARFGATKLVRTNERNSKVTMEELGEFPVVSEADQKSQEN